MFDIHRTTEVPVKAASNPVPPRDIRVAEADIASYILQLAKESS
jgi:hypothetical protein